MAAYVNRAELKAELKSLVRQFVEESVNCEELTPDFIDLIKHNFRAKFVYYNKKKKMIEIGVNESKTPSLYPEIKVYSFPVQKADKWLKGTYKDHPMDLDFYGRLINKKRSYSNSEVILY